MRKSKSGLLISSLALAIMSSLCCIVPILTIVGGLSGAASSFGWVQPYRPYLIAATVTILGIAFYQAYRPVKKDNCGCAIEKKHFLQSKTFLWIITVMSVLLMTFPYYSDVFANRERKGVKVVSGKIENASFKVIGMTCESCERHVNSVLLNQAGVVNVVTTFQDSTTTVEYDHSKTSLSVLMAEVSKQTGYKTAP